MLKKPQTCSSCPLYEKGKGFVPDTIVPKAEYLIYGEAPGSTEIELNKPFQGKAGFVLKEWIMRAVPHFKLAEEKNKISYANVLRCLPPEIQGRPYPRGQERVDAERCCKQYANMGDASTVVLTGESPQRFLFGPELEAEDAVDRSLGHDLKGVMGRIGRVYEREGRRYVFAPHPAYVLRQPALVQHAQAVFKIACNTETVLDVDYIIWESALEDLYTM